jgi:hypothetical protein
MKRDEFLKSACTLGFCSCAAIPFLSNKNLFSEHGTPAPEGEEWKIGFMQRRFAKLIEAINLTDDQKQREALIEAVGRACAAENKEAYIKYKNNLEGYFTKIQKEWVEKVEYNKDENTIRVIGKKMESCFCPFVDKTKTPKEFCNCSAGNMKETYETILGKDVSVKIEKSILRGGENCVFLIKVA